MDLKKLVSTMGILGLFTFSMMAFIIITQTDSNIEYKITDDEFISQAYENLSINLGSTDTESSAGSFGDVPPTEKYGEVSISSIFSITGVAKNIVYGFWNIFVKLPQNVLGVSESVITLISSILLIMLIIGIWAVWKGVVS